MSTLSIELVPRDHQSLQDEMLLIREHFPAVETINIPDLLKFPLRSWEACRQAKALFPHAIPHLRAIDFDLRQSFPLVEDFSRSGIDTVLVIAGDQPQDMSRRVYRTAGCSTNRRI